MAKANILSYVHQETIAHAIREVLKASADKAAWFAKAPNCRDACLQFSKKCGFTVTESNLRHMLEQLKIDPREIIDIKQPKRSQKKSTAETVPTNWVVTREELDGIINDVNRIKKHLGMK